MRIFKYHHDPAHGWLAVKLDLLDELNLVDQISTYSYLKGKTAYLEEDLDCTLFVQKYREKYGTFSEQPMYYDKRCPVRGYNHYSPKLAREILDKSRVRNRF